MIPAKRTLTRLLLGEFLQMAARHVAELEMAKSKILAAAAATFAAAGLVAAAYGSRALAIGSVVLAVGLAFFANKLWQDDRP